MKRIEKYCGFILVDENNQKFYEGADCGTMDNGLCFKDKDAFQSHEGICYIPEAAWDDCDGEYISEAEAIKDGYTYDQFLAACNNDEKLAEYVFEELFWCCPETYVDGLDLKDWSDEEYDDSLDA